MRLGCDKVTLSVTVASVVYTTKGSTNLDGGLRCLSAQITGCPRGKSHQGCGKRQAGISCALSARATRLAFRRKPETFPLRVQRFHSLSF
jgi:hypothetical protein